MTDSLRRLIAPCRPAITARAREQFDLRHAGIAALDHLVIEDWLGAVLAPPFAVNRGWLSSRQWRRHFTAPSDQQQFVLIAGVISRADQFLIPHKACAISETPRIDDLQALGQLRRGRP